MALDLNSLLASSRVHQRLSKDALKARLEQRALAEKRAFEYAHELAKRQTVANGLASESLDAMRLRWLAEHPSDSNRILWTGGIESVRRDIDTLIKQDAFRGMSAKRREQVDL